MRARDTGRGALYDAESMLLAMFARSGSGRGVEIAGTTVTLPVEAQFASADSVRDHVGRVLAMPSVQARFPRAAVPVVVRERRGHAKAEYIRVGGAGSRTPGEIAIPTSGEGRWALRELVVLHELAHHLDDSDGPAHGRGFVVTLIDLVELVLGPEAGFVYRVVLADSGVLG